MSNDIAIATNRTADFQKGPRVQAAGADNAQRSARRLEGGAVRREPDRAIETQAADSADSRKAASRSQGGAQSFDGLVERMEDADMLAQEANQAQGEVLQPVQQMPLVAAQFTGLLQRLGSEGVDGRNAEIALLSRDPQQSEAKSSNIAVLLRDGNADRTLDDLPAMIGRAAQPEDINSAQSDAALRPQAAEAAKTTEVSVEALRQETNFANPITVVANEQRKFQPAQAVVSRMAMLMLQNGARLASLQPSTAAISVDAFAADNANAGLPAWRAEQSGLPVAEQRMGRGHESHQAPEVPGGQKSDGFEFIRDVAGSAELASRPGDGAALLSAPSQQVRGAIADAISSAAPAPATDYVSLFDEHQTTPSLIVRTLHLALNPQGLGQVEIKMNLAGNELRLEIEASRADTARLIALDRDELDRELRYDGVELTSLSVSSREAVSDPEKAPATNGESQGNGFGQGAEADMADLNARRDQDGARREARSLTLPLQAKSAADAVGVAPVANSSALYI